MFTATPSVQLPTVILFEDSIMLIFSSIYTFLTFLDYNNLKVFGKFYHSSTLKPQELLFQIQFSGPPAYHIFHQLDGMPAHIL